MRVYLFESGRLSRMDVGGATLDAASLRLPEGAYTTMRTLGPDRIVGLSAHLRRLADSLALARRTRALDTAAIRPALREVLKRESLPAARIRMTAPFDGEQVFISLEPFEAYPPECYTRGVRCATLRLSRDTPRAKLTGFIAPSRAAKAGHGAGIHELLLVDAGGRILEGVTSNFFAVIDGTLRTAGEGVLEGITRGLVLEEAKGIARISLDAIRLADLARVPEAFITSSSRDAMPVVQIDDTTIGAGKPGPLTQTLMNRYRARLAQAAEQP